VPRFFNLPICSNHYFELAITWLSNNLFSANAKNVFISNILLMGNWLYQVATTGKGEETGCMKITTSTQKAIIQLLVSKIGYIIKAFQITKKGRPL